ncbi:ATP-dependent Zn protease [Spirulina sp. CCNP1310]|uniref:ATP-dependent Zn protease n=1 Tax=Spirulina sp. CCNP1310 TaxID=3110249 RepID=UPI002B21EF30|nr:ATP-dependent Zn protease [Spirulina sp. CCNP1310]MEA5418705.1 ATP-dependent Zn protease [Spirulina sp. CCNP1310]
MLQQTTLNLIAIGVFLMVMSVLLGPLIQLPAAVPAGATLSFMVLFAADTLAWQGRGGNLLVDAVARLSPQHRDRVLYHEAGHFLVAYAYGLPITGYTLSAWEAWRQGKPGFGGVEWTATDGPGDRPGPVLQKQWLDRFCIIAMAGIAAERLQYGSVEGGNDDRQQVSQALTALGQPQQQVAAKQQWAELQAKMLIQNHQAAYEALVAGMRSRSSVADCVQSLTAAGLSPSDALGPLNRS